MSSTARHIGARVIDTRLHRGRTRPWGYEIPVTFVDDDGNEYNEVLLFRRANRPSDRVIQDALAEQIARIEAVVEPPPENDMVSKQEVVRFLESKNYLRPNEMAELLAFLGLSQARVV